MTTLSFKKLLIIASALVAFAGTLGLPESSFARCKGDLALAPVPRVSVEETLADQLSQWIEKNGHVPSFSSSDLTERMQARIWKTALSVQKIKSSLSPYALAKITAATLGEEPSTYDTVPLLKKFEGENKGIDIWSDRAQKVIHFQTHYLATEAERAPFKITIRDGLVYDANGNIFDSSDADLKGLSNSKGKAMVVMTSDGTIYASKDQELGKLHHSTLVNGGPIAFAGEMIVKNGVITEIKNLSGHYFPPTELYAQFLDRLIAGEVPVDTIDLQGVVAAPPAISEITRSLFGPNTPEENLSATFHQAKKFMDLTAYSELLESLLKNASKASQAAVEKAVTAIDHVGFLVPAGTTIEMLERVAQKNGFTEGQRSFASVIVAKELGVPTQIFICKEKLPSGEFRAIEVFIPSGDADQINPWIEKGVGTHVAFRASSNDGIEDIKEHLSTDGFEMPEFMNKQAMANPQQGSLTIYFDMQRGPQKLRMEFVHTK